MTVWGDLRPGDVIETGSGNTLALVSREPCLNYCYDTYTFLRLRDLLLMRFDMRPGDLCPELSLVFWGSTNEATCSR